MADKFIIGLVLIALISGVFWSWQGFGKLPASDQRAYDGVALSILGNGSFSWEGEAIFFEPLYPLFLAGIYSIFGPNYDVVRVVQIILFVLIVLIIYLLAKELFNRRIAVVASLLTALFYPLANAAGKLEREMFFAFLLVLLVYVLYQTYLKKEKKWFALSGIILGLVTLTNGIAQLLFLLIVINFLIVLRKQKPFKEIILKCGIFLLFFVLILSPWLVRNYFQYSGVTVAPRGGGLLISRVETMESVYKNYWGYFIGHTLGYYFAEKLYPQMNIHEFRYPERGEEETVEIQEIRDQGYNQQDLDQIFMKKSLSRILSQPHKYLLMSFLDFIAFNNPIIPRPPTFNYSNIFMTFAEGRYSGWPDWLKASIILTIRFIWLAFFIFVVYAVVKNIKNWPKISWIILIILYFNVVYSLVHAIPRYALPIYPFYIILFSAGIYTVIVRKFAR